MNKSELILQRFYFLKQFDKYVRNVIGDDIITEYWITYGVPDGYSLIDLEEIAKDDNLWLDVVKAFAHCLRAEIEELEEEED